MGYALASEELTSAIRKVHDFLTVGAPAPLQQAVATAMRFADSYYTHLRTEYLQRRDFLMTELEAAGFRCFKPYGAYYIMTDISEFGFPDDTTFARALIRNVGVAAVPGSSFYNDPRTGHRRLRFGFPKKMETLEKAAALLRHAREKLR
ncbi:MAG TPA: aminotransferase class I/II-fold pyridoxal phosphate-dependent enzyme [Acidobacteriota bacterium]|nr:aminotransferase class I/II-fold pyridoxal phosphate-dependent enzyme [Acidobacteriota bacterium]